MLASVKLHHPDCLGSVEWLTFGRVRPAHLNAVAYGWAASADIGTGLWLMARLCRTPLRHSKLLIGAAIGGVAGYLYERRRLNAARSAPPQA